MCGDWHQATDLAQIALIKLHAAWGRVSRRDDLSVDFSKDTVMALPAGVGDTILKTDLTDAGHVHVQSWTGHTLLDLTSPSDQQWLAAVARSMVARHTGATGR